MQRSLEWRQRTQQKAENMLLRDFLYLFQHPSVLACSSLLQISSPWMCVKVFNSTLQLCASPGGRAVRDPLLCHLNSVYNQLGSPAQ